MEEKSQKADEGEKSKEHTNSEKCKESEILFRNYLNNLKIPFYYIDQSKEAFSDELQDKQIHRPDFILHTNVGIFYIDVKFRKKMNFGENNEARFYLNQYELCSLHNFQNEFHLPVWISFTDNLDKPDFCFASISELYEYFKIVSENIIEECFIYIPSIFLYDHFSFYNGIYKGSDQNFYEIEKKYHIEASRNIKNPKAIKWSRINNYNNL
jgi:hypothetical protein